MGSRWYRWPENRQRGRVAWFVIARRVFFVPLVFVGKVLLFVAVAGGWGLDDAIRDWKAI